MFASCYDGFMTPRSFEKVACVELNPRTKKGQIISLYKSNHKTIIHLDWPEQSSQSFFLSLSLSLSLSSSTHRSKCCCFFRTETLQLSQRATTGKMPLWLLRESRKPLGSDPWEHSRLAGWKRWTLFGTPLSNGTRPGKPYPWQHGAKSKWCLLPLRHPRYDRASRLCEVKNWRHWWYVTSSLNRKSHERPFFFLSLSLSLSPFSLSFFFLFPYVMLSICNI